MKEKRAWRARLNFILQGLLAGILCFCASGLSGWMDSGISFSRMNLSFEETAQFCETVDRIIRDKIAGAQDRQLFETDGEYQELKEIDIRQYISGNSDPAYANTNTTYYLCDLIYFADNGADRMEDRLNTLSAGGKSEESVGRTLMNESEELETILPLSAVSLADYATFSENPNTAVQDYYRTLVDVSRDIAYRYSRYLGVLASGEDPEQAPSNVWYYVENTTTGQRYTNLGVKSLVAARTLVSENDDALLLFEGERRFNIMVSDNAAQGNEAAFEYFMQSRFLGSGEKVLIASDLTYAAGDELHAAELVYRKRRPYLIAALAASVLAGVGLVVLLVLFVMRNMRTGRAEAAEGSAAPGRAEPEEGSVVPGRAERILAVRTFSAPTELAIGITAFAGISWWMLSSAFLDSFEYRSRFIYRYGPSLRLMGEHWICLAGAGILIRRLSSHTLWTNSILYTVVMGGRYVHQARKSSEYLIILYVLFVVLNMTCLLMGGAAGTVMVIILNFAALLFLMRDVVGNQSLREGLDQISQGKLDYRINTSILSGESREMGEAINEMGEGLQQSVDAMLQHERLKAELITNVSHDLKTPLTSIMNYVDLLKREDLPGERAQEYVRILDEKTRRLRQLTEDLIEVSRINSGNVALDIVPVRLDALLRQACGEMEDVFLQRSLRMVLVLPDGTSFYPPEETEETGDTGDMEAPRPGPEAAAASQSGRGKIACVILADGAQLWRVLENLLGNAAKYAKEETAVTITVTMGEASVRTVISNIPQTPIRVSAEELEERFARGDVSRSTEGSGLGLSIARSLTELMGGQFSLRVEEALFEAVLDFPRDGAQKGAQPVIPCSDM